MLLVEWLATLEFGPSLLSTANLTQTICSDNAISNMKLGENLIQGDHHRFGAKGLTIQPGAK